VQHQIADTPNRICDLKQIGHEIAHENALVTSPEDEKSVHNYARNIKLCIQCQSLQTNLFFLPWAAALHVDDRIVVPVVLYRSIYRGQTQGIIDRMRELALKWKRAGFKLGVSHLGMTLVIS
jgi:hypothetical protein